MATQLHYVTLSLSLGTRVRYRVGVYGLRLGSRLLHFGNWLLSVPPKVRVR